MQIKDKALIKGFSFVVEFLELEPVANKVTFWTRPQIQVQVHEPRSFHPTDRSALSFMQSDSSGRQFPFSQVQCQQLSFEPLAELGFLTIDNQRRVSASNSTNQRRSLAAAVFQTPFEEKYDR